MSLDFFITDLTVILHDLFPYGKSFHRLFQCFSPSSSSQMLKSPSPFIESSNELCFTLHLVRALCQYLVLKTCILV